VCLCVCVWICGSCDCGCVCDYNCNFTSPNCSQIPAARRARQRDRSGRIRSAGPPALGPGPPGSLRHGSKALDLRPSSAHRTASAVYTSRHVLSHSCGAQIEDFLEREQEKKREKERRRAAERERKPVPAPPLPTAQPTGEAHA
jgi:hypothetical protein